MTLVSFDIWKKIIGFTNFKKFNLVSFTEFDVLDDEDLDDEEHEYDDEESSEGESEPETEDEDAYVKSDKKLKRVKNAFIDDEAEEEDDIEFQNDDPEDQKQQKENIDEEDTMHLTLDDDDVEGIYNIDKLK